MKKHIQKLRALLGTLVLLPGLVWAKSGDPGPAPTLTIPRLSRAPALEDFLSMKPEGGGAEAMIRVTGFVQRDPHEGEPVSQRTEGYLGYDNKNLYVVFVCFDDPAKVRAHESRREDVYDDDTVEIMLDTFHDRRRAYAFQTNPLGVQWDAIWTEAPKDSFNGNPNFDPSFDTLWYSKGRLTSQGYVVWMAIPFKSLRFSPEGQQSWGIILYRGIVRENENSFWPAIARKVEGRLGKAASMKGLEGVSPGRNMQFIPYGVADSFRSLDTRDSSFPHFDNRTLGGKLGLDSKFIFHDNLVLDVTANPDFSQVESDEPQVTVNQRFEVFFPEKRPFFLENSDYFQTPINLFFTRRIKAPTAGVRLTGRVGHYALGVLAADDRSPGLAVAANDPLAGKHALFTIARVNRDLFRQSTVGAIYTDREFPATGAFNRIGGLDTRLRFTPSWTGTFQGVVSSTRNDDGSYQAGPAYLADTTYSGEHLSYRAIYDDISPGFSSDPGFVYRVDLRDFRNGFNYRWRPKSGPLVAWGPSWFNQGVWAHDGTRLDTSYQPVLALRFKRQTSVNLFPYTTFRERLRPSDYPVLPDNRDFHQHNSGVGVGTSYLQWLTVQGYYQWGDGVNFLPPANQPPVLARADFGNLYVSVRPSSRLKIDNSYLFNRLRDRATGAAMFNNHIARSKWNWQYNRELSLRVILQYTTTLARPGFTSLQSTKNFNADFLITYLLHPGTAVYIGYNSNLQNLDPSLGLDPDGNLLRTRSHFINDGRLFFVKVSYLLRF